MTNREAIDILEEVKAFDDSIYAYNPAYNAALDKAIDSLRSSSAAQFQRLTVDGVTLYRCDPAKNTVCSKTGCFVDGGQCYLTKHKDFEKTEGGTDAADYADTPTLMSAT